MTGICRSLAALLLSSLALATLLAPGAAFALPSFELTLTDGNLLSPFNLSDWSLRNTSTAGESITSFAITIGDTGYEFDYIRDASSSWPFYTIAPGTTGVSVLTGDSLDGFAATDRIDLAFTDFQAGEQFDFSVDIDQDGFFGAAIADARQVLFNNGTTANGTLQLGFSDGSSMNITLPDADPTATSFVFNPATGGASGSGGSVVPEPDTSLLMGLGLAGLAFAGRRRAA